MKNFDLENVDCHATLGMIEKRWEFLRRTLRALLGMTKNAQSGRSLLSECGADAPTVLSAVYTDSTPAKNRQADVPQYGRSMIEMLGVLAIIGVLSVGGIAGYSKAMTKYRVNKSIEQITLIAGNVRSFFAPQRSYEGLSTTVIKKAKLVPDEMWDGDYIKNVFGKDVILEAANKSASGDSQAFLMYWSIPASNNEEYCIDLLSQDWTDVGIKGFHQFGAEGKNATVPLNLDKAIDICGNLGYSNTIFMYFDVNSTCWDETESDPNTCS